MAQDNCAAEIGLDGFVVRVIVIPDAQVSRVQDYCANDLGLGGTWRHTRPDKTVDGSYAGPEMEWLSGSNEYSHPRPYKSWRREGRDWLPPVGKEMPTDGKDYYWDETKKSWVEKPTAIVRI
jgi:hypothetical protein